MQSDVSPEPRDIEKPSLVSAIALMTGLMVLIIAAIFYLMHRRETTWHITPPVVAEKKAPPLWRSSHRHYHLSSSSRAELSSALTEFGLSPQGKSSEAVSVLVPVTRLREFTRRVDGLNGRVMDFHDPAKTEGAADESVQISFYFMG